LILYFPANDFAFTARDSNQLSNKQESKQACSRQAINQLVKYQGRLLRGLFRNAGLSQEAGRQAAQHISSESKPI